MARKPAKTKAKTKISRKRRTKKKTKNQFFKKIFQKNLGMILATVLLVLALISWAYISFFNQQWRVTSNRPIKILRINSYTSGQEWTDASIEAFLQVFTEKEVDVEFQEFEFDRTSLASEEDREIKALEAVEVVNDWQPDLIYLTDDPVHKYINIIEQIDSQTPIVFSTFLGDPIEKGYDKAENIAGILERAHIVPIFDYYKKFYPGEKKVVVFTSDSHNRIAIFEELKEKQDQIKNIEFIGWEESLVFEDFQEKVLSYQDKADALVFVGFPYVDTQGNEINYQETIRWIVNNSHIPELTFWDVFVKEGLLMGISVSPSEQGRAAGEVAYKILLEGRSPASFGFKSTQKGDEIFNLARAKMLGLDKTDIPSKILINSEVVETFPWEE